MCRFAFFGLVAVLLAMATPTLAEEPSAAAAAAQDGWTFVTVRDETAPQSAVRANGGSYALVITGNGETISDGRWVKRVPLPQAAYVKLTARFRASDVEQTARSVVASLLWTDDAGKPVTDPEFAATTAPPDAQGWRPIVGVFKVPAKAKHAQIELRLRWSPKGEVEFRDADVTAAEAPKPRVVKIAA